MMPTLSEQALRQFQIELSSKGQARIVPVVSQEVLSTICSQEDISVRQMARTTGIQPRTAHNYTSHIHSPNIDKFVRMLDKLGYSLHIMKHGPDKTQ